MRNAITLLALVISTSIFSQAKSEPAWYQMDRDGEYLKMASYLLFKVQSDSTRNAHADYLHIARAYGYLNDYEKAIFYLNKSMLGRTGEKDQQFWWYYKGTLAFFERDKKALKKYLENLEANHTSYYENNYKTLKSLYENFDKGYLKASKWKKEESQTLH